MRTEFERMVGGHLYNSTGKDLFFKHAKGLITCQRFNKTAIWNVPKQKYLLHKLIPSTKKNYPFIFPPFYCEYGINITVGKDVFLNYGCTLLDVAPIVLEDSVWLGANVTLATPCHPLIAEERISQEYPDGYHDLEYAKPITLKKGCWIASCATICGGVTVGEGSVVGAGSVVTRDVPPNTFVAGVPAKVVRQITDDDKIDVWQTYCNDQEPLPRRLRKQVDDAK